MTSLYFRKLCIYSIGCRGLYAVYWQIWCLSSENVKLKKSLHPIITQLKMHSDRGCWILNMFSLSMCHSTIYHKLPHLYYKYSHLSSLRNSSFFTVVLESIGWVYFQGSSSQKLTSLGLKQLLKGKWWVARCRSCSQTAAFMQSNPARHTGRFCSVGIYKFQLCNVQQAWRWLWSCFCDSRQTSVPNSTCSSPLSDACCLRVKTVAASEGEPQ